MVYLIKPMFLLPPIGTTWGVFSGVSLGEAVAGVSLGSVSVGKELCTSLPAVRQRSPVASVAPTRTKCESEKKDQHRLAN